MINSNLDNVIINNNPAICLIVLDLILDILLSLVFQTLRIDRSHNVTVYMTVTRCFVSCIPES